MSFRVGDRIECNWQGRGLNFRGTVVSTNGDAYDIKFDDGDFEGGVPLDRLRPASSNEKNPITLGIGLAQHHQRIGPLQHMNQTQMAIFHKIAKHIANGKKVVQQNRVKNPANLCMSQQV